MSEYKFPVEASHIMMFARSVGDTNRIYHDEEYAKGTEPGAVIAPPTFGRACTQFDPDYHLRPKQGGSHGSARVSDPRDCPKARRRRAAEGCMRSNILNTTAISGRGMC